MKKILFLLLTTSIFYLSSCASAKQGKWLTEHNRVLTNALGDNVSSQDKIDAIASSFTQAMHQSLNHLDPRKSVQYMTKYTEENEAMIETLSNQISGYTKGMDTMEQVGLALNLMQKPYFNDLITLFPRFINKFKAINSIMKLGGNVRNSLAGAGSKELMKLGEGYFNKMGQK